MSLIVIIFCREACYYVSKTEVDGYDAAVQCAMSASGARLAVAVEKAELMAFLKTTPRQALWIGSAHIRFQIQFNQNLIM